MTHHHRFLIRLTASLFVLALLLGCAAIFKGNTDHIPATSNPPGVLVLVDGIPVGRTPTQISLSADRDHIVTFRLDNGLEQHIPIGRVVGAGWVVLDVLFTGLVGLVVDGITGAWFYPEQDGLHIDVPMGPPMQGYPAQQPQYGPQPQYAPQPAPQQYAPQPAPQRYAP